LEPSHGLRDPIENNPSCAAGGRELELYLKTECEQLPFPALLLGARKELIPMGLQ
jgi:hypothetical protein